MESLGRADKHDRMRPSAKALAAPIAIPVGFVLWSLALFALRIGNPHGGAAYLFLFGMISGAAVALWEIAAVAWAVTALLRREQLRTFKNVAAVVLAVLYLAAAGAAYIAYRKAVVMGVAHEPTATQ